MEERPIPIQGEYDQFIGVYRGAVPKEACMDMISYFHDLEDYNMVYDRRIEGTNPLRKQDFSANLNAPTIGKVYNRYLSTSAIGQYIIKDFLYRCVMDYVNQYDTLSEFIMGTNENKIQRTEIGGGYHVWHCEQGMGNMNRVLVYTIYLNDVLEGGETEFLYQNKRLPARQGDICIFPAHFTHPHRGNPPISNEKYIVTGWIDHINHMELPNQGKW
jgi:hypothetical protein